MENLMSGNDVSPSIWYYGLALLIVVAGFAVFALSIYGGISDMQSSLLQIVAPGNSELDLPDPGEYTIFYENNSYLDGKFYSTSEQISGLVVRVREKATGRELATYPAAGSFTYSMGSRSGRSIMAFKAPAAGIYQINSSYSGQAGPEIVLAVGTGVATGMISSIMLSLAALFGSIAIAAVISYVTYSRRKKALARIGEDESLTKGGF
jgi:hypothetical protein